MYLLLCQLTYEWLFMRIVNRWSSADHEQSVSSSSQVKSKHDSPTRSITSWYSFTKTELLHAKMAIQLVKKTQNSHNLPKVKGRQGYRVETVTEISTKINFQQDKLSIWTQVRRNWPRFARPEFDIGEKKSYRMKKVFASSGFKSGFSATTWRSTIISKI